MSPVSAGRCACLTAHGGAEPRCAQGLCGCASRLRPSLEPQGRASQTILGQGLGTRCTRHCVGCSYGGRNANEKPDLQAPARQGLTSALGGSCLGAEGGHALC